MIPPFGFWPWRWVKFGLGMGKETLAFPSKKASGQEGRKSILDLRWVGLVPKPELPAPASLPKSKACSGRRAVANLDTDREQISP